ncbi:probable serine/threonine-protein kinase kinX [Apis cerana]|uniref:probable serine/threonine-protein kinase kinX n=1 Tax=Apis cerana TaxID=7461 RepID=UPI002B238EB7|nr:probable serine/threonine-protein kinase kinX [Apis cerana]
MDEEINEWDVSEDLTEDDLDFDTSKISKPSSAPGSKLEQIVSVQTQSTSVQSNPVQSFPSKENPLFSGTFTDERDKESKNSIEESKNQDEFKKSTSLGQLGKDASQKHNPKSGKTYRKCQRKFKEMIINRELKNEELEKQQGDLKHRLNILECSMPAVMVWNIWRMAQGTCVPNLQRVMEKQFQGPASGEVYCPRTPSRHFDCRVREVEAERKEAQRRMDEARNLWTEKEALLEDKMRRLGEVKILQEEMKEKIEKLTVEAQKLKEAYKVEDEDDRSCEAGSHDRRSVSKFRFIYWRAGECGVIECKKKWLKKLPSNASIKSTDIECLEKLQELAETELYMKRQIAELENREDAYMRTLQQADDMWCKLDSDVASTISSLQEQLEMKTAANQQMADRIVELEDVIEKLRSRLSTCRGELEKYLSVSKIEALVGKEDDFADVLDIDVAVKVDIKEKLIGVEDYAEIEEIEVLAKIDVEEKDILAVPEIVDDEVEAKPEIVDVDVEVKPEIVDDEVEVKPEIVDEEVEVIPELVDVDVEIKPDVVDDEVEIKPDVIEAEMEAVPDTIDVKIDTDVVKVEDEEIEIKPEDFVYQEEMLEEASEYLAQITSLSELDKYDDDFVCPEGFICNDVVLTETGLTEEEMIALKEKRITPQELLEKHGWKIDIEDLIAKKPPVTVIDEPPIPITEEIKIEPPPIEKIEPVEVEREPDVLVEKPIKEYPVEEITPIEEKIDVPEPFVEPVEEIRPIEEITPVEEIRPVEEITPVEEIRPIEEPIEPIAEVIPPEVIKVEERPIEEIRPVEEPTPIEEIKPTPEVYPPEPPIKVERPDIPIDMDNIIIPRMEILSWEDDVDTIRATIAVLIIL